MVKATTGLTVADAAVFPAHRLKAIADSPHTMATADALRMAAQADAAVVVVAAAAINLTVRAF